MYKRLLEARQGRERKGEGEVPVLELELELGAVTSCRHSRQRPARPRAQSSPFPVTARHGTAPLARPRNDSRRGKQYSFVVSFLPKRLFEMCE